ERVTSRDDHMSLGPANNEDVRLEYDVIDQLSVNGLDVRHLGHHSQSNAVISRDARCYREHSAKIGVGNTDGRAAQTAAGRERVNGNLAGHGNGGRTVVRSP